MIHHINKTKTFRPNLVASNIENLIVLISSMEHRYEMGVKNLNRLDDTNSTSSNSNDNRIEEEPEDTIMKRRIQIAKLVRIISFI